MNVIKVIDKLLDKNELDALQLVAVLLEQITDYSDNEYVMGNGEYLDNTVSEMLDHESMPRLF